MLLRYLIIPAVNCNCELRGTELAHIEDWAEKNNLWLNCAKTKEIVFRAKGKRGLKAPIPPPCEGIERISSLTVLGVVISCRLCQWLVDVMLQAAVCITRTA